MPFTRERLPDDVQSPEALAKVSGALRKLDAFSFWVLPSPEPGPGDLIVAGTTGIFLVATCGMQGALTFGPTGGIVGGKNVPALRGLKRATKALQVRVSDAAVYVQIEPVVCLTDAVTGAPHSFRGVRYVHVKDLARDLGGRPARLERGRAQRAARALGMSIAGDDQRHFSPR